ncbi:DUF6968 family protein [Azorhizobium doebereinerae]|uniref:DUF6968 family protein n=1 Tax=Azorhizobium doebereinerae TaxID=281091 RepID=UPI0003FE4BFB|nr:hypothetical protein [Azorhizobium doebereinerae]
MIASRILTLTLPTGTVEVPIRIYAPEFSGTSWSCRYETDWPEGRRTMSSRGFDAVQALLMAMQMIAADIYASNYHAAGQLHFQPDWEGYGFPVTGMMRDMLIGDDRKYL